MSKHKTFETARLILKPTSEEDAEFIFELMNAPKWIKFIGNRKIKTVDLAKEYIKNKMLAQQERLGYGNYTLIQKLDHAKIGTCGLYVREGVAGVDIGFAFLPEFEKKGYGFEAADKLKNMSFNEFGINELTAYTTKNNFSSQKLLLKLGFKLIGTTVLPKDDEELQVYKISNSQT